MDYNATTPLEPEVIQAITEALQDAWGNPSSSYIAGKGTFPFFCLLGTKPPQPHCGLSPGAKAKAMINQSRENVARMVGGRAEDIIFTSGGTEVKQLSVRLGPGWYWASSRGSRLSDLLPGQQPGPPHSRGALLEELRSLGKGRHRPSSHHHLQRGARLGQTGRRAPPERKEGRWEAAAAAKQRQISLCGVFFSCFAPSLPLSVSDVTFVPVSRLTGRAEVEEVVAAVRPNTCLISIMLANNETGVIMVRDGERPRMFGLNAAASSVGNSFLICSCVRLSNK